MSGHNGNGRSVSTLEDPGVRVGGEDKACGRQGLEVPMRSRDSAPPVSPEERAKQIDAAIDAYIAKIGQKPTDEQMRLVEQANGEMDFVYEYHKHQLLTLVLLTDGGIAQKPQEDHCISEENICSEISTINAYEGDPAADFETMVVVHKKHTDEGGEVHVVPLCELCRVEYTRNCPNVKVIVYYKGQYWVLPLLGLLTLIYGQVTGLDPKIEVPEPIKAAIRILFRTVGRKADQEEEIWARETVIALERNHAHDPKQRFFAAAVTEKMSKVFSRQPRVQKGPYPCAELGIYNRMSGSGIGLKQIVCAFMGADDKAHIGTLCEADLGRFMERHPDLEVIVEFEGELWVLPIKALLLLPYKKRKNGREVKHHRDHKFTGEEHKNEDRPT